ncbi:MAG: glycosyltransferase family 2 protein [Candidatus Lokiarchaeota archaeon]|nr:glycosyltransferase family 2 protein [Candidatus Lokiarchaeota archaeon]
MEEKDNFDRFSFSILMASFNNEKYIEVAIKSVISQTYPFWELIIVDDRSTDNTLERITPFLTDNRIRLLKHKKNLGYSASLKTAINNATHEIIGILDSDDKLHENALEIMAQAYKENLECGFIYSTMWNCDSDLKNCVLNKYIQEIVPPKTSIFDARISHFKTFTKKAYNQTSGFDRNQKRAVDKDIIYKLEEVTNFKFINKPLYYYRYHSGGISQAKNVDLAYLYSYRAKCKAYQRRLDKNLPNLNLNYLYTQYFIITLKDLITFVKKYIRLFRIKKILNKLDILYPYEKRSQNRFMNFILKKPQIKGRIK